jgi:hypothetical protein
MSLGELARIHDELITLPLATYRYQVEGPEGRVRLGFMIDGHETLLASDAQHDQVDLYSYTSMAVAALKVQAAEIEELKNELASLKSQPKHQGCELPPPPTCARTRGLASVNK